ncbi:MAG TPA: hypothetical protein VF619_06895, partial [Allosphingosinicella sp.]
DAAREIGRWCDPDNRLTCTDQDLLGPGRFRLAATVQIAIDQILGAEETRERFDSDPVFAQLAFDTLYYIPRCLQRDADEPVDVSKDALAKELVNRIGPRAKQEASESQRAAAAAEPRISSIHLRELESMLHRLVVYLSDFELLRDDLLNRAAKIESSSQASTLKDSAEILLLERGRLLHRPDPEKPSLLRFHLDEMARVLPNSAEPHASSPGGEPPAEGASSETEAATTLPSPRAATIRRSRTPSPRRGPSSPPSPPDVSGFVTEHEAISEQPKLLASPRLSEARGLLDSFTSLLSIYMLDIDDLREAGLLPGTVNNRLLAGLSSDLEIAERNPGRGDAVERALDAHLTLARALDIYGPEIASALCLLIGVYPSDPEFTGSPGVVLRRIARYFDPLSPLIVPMPLRLRLDWAHMAGDSSSIASFAEALRSWIPRLPLIEDTSVSEAWRLWKMTLDALTADPARAQEPLDPRWADVVLAAADRPPGNLFRLRMARMSLLDWSTAALSTLPGVKRPPQAPHWLLFASLLAMGFDRTLLMHLQKERLPWTSPVEEDDDRLIARFVDRAPMAEPATLYLFGRAPPSENLPVLSGEPILAISRGDFADYTNAIDYLASRGAFREVVYDGPMDPDLRRPDSLADMPWVQVSRIRAPSERAARAGEVVFNVRTTKDLREAGRRLSRKKPG